MTLSFDSHELSSFNKAAGRISNSTLMPIGFIDQCQALEYCCASTKVSCTSSHKIQLGHVNLILLSDGLIYILGYVFLKTEEGEQHLCF